MRFKVRRFIVVLAVVAALISLIAMPGVAHADNTWCVKAGYNLDGTAEPTTGTCTSTPTDEYLYDACVYDYHWHHSENLGRTIGTALQVCFAIP